MESVCDDSKTANYYNKTDKQGETMALSKCALNTNNKKKELQPHGSIEFPCAAYESSHTDSICDFISWHWQAELIK